MIKTFSMVTLGGIISTVATYFLTVILSHILTVEDYGVVARWLTDIGYVSIFFTLGLNASMIYFTRKSVKLSEGMGFNVSVYTILLLLSLLAIFIFGDRTYLYTLVLTVFFFAINEAVRAHYQFNEEFGVFNFMVVFRPLLLLLTFTILYLSIKSSNIKSVLLLYTLAMGISSIVYCLKYFSSGNTIHLPHRDVFRVRPYLKYGVKNILNQLLSISLYAISIYLISWTGNYTNVAYYFVASSISKMAWVLPDSTGNILYPLFIKSKTQDEKEKSIKTMFTYAQLVFILNLVALVSFLLFGRLILSILYEESYRQAFVPILILLIGNQGMVYYKFFSRWHAAQNTWRHVYIATLVGIVVSVLMNLILAPKYGIIGVSLATSISFWACGYTICLPIKGSFRAFLNLSSFWKNRKLLLSER